MPNTMLQLGELLGSGGMGQVHASCDRDGRKIAVKRVHDRLADDPLYADRLIEEARLLGNVCHPNVVRTFGLRESDGMPVLVMDRVAGKPLGELLREASGLPLPRLMVIAQQLLAGVGAIHDAGVIHGDLKANNVLVDEVDVVTIIDFGLARVATETGFTNGVVAGTAAYMAPELIDGCAPTVASDLYAVATIIYEMLTGTRPFAGALANILAQHIHNMIERPSKRAPERGITDAVDRVVMRALSRSPDDRQRDARSFSRELAAALATMPVSGEPVVDDHDPMISIAPSRLARGSQQLPVPATDLV